MAWALACALAAGAAGAQQAPADPPPAPQAPAQQAAATTQRISVPFRIRTPLIGRLLAEALMGRDLTLELRPQGDGCGALRLTEPKVATAPDRLDLETQLRATPALRVAGRCARAGRIDGQLAMQLAPSLDEASQRIRLRVVSLELISPPGTPPLLARASDDLVDDLVRARVEATSIDLSGAIGDIRQTLLSIIPPERAADRQQLADSVGFSDLRFADDGASLALHFDIAPGPVPLSPEPPLGPNERDALEVALRAWDAFLGFVIREIGEDASTPELQAALLDVLVEGRREIVTALMRESRPGADPVRRLFSQTWDRLAPVLREIEGTRSSERSFHYLVFMAASDALVAVESAGPAFGFELDSQGLRRLARALAPSARGDPLAYSDAVDPELRRVLGFGPPLPASNARGAGPAGGAEPGAAPPGAGATPDHPEAPAPDAAPRDGTPPDGAAARATRLIAALLDWLFPPARAEPVLENTPESLASRVGQWVPTRDQTADYVALMRPLLLSVAALTREEGFLGPEASALFGPLVLATAWQESCWRQYSEIGGEVQPLRSPVGAVGVMQVYERVWRGFYDPALLRWDLAYNARAGAEILLHYLRDQALLRVRDASEGTPDALARATYAMYNGGPGARTRWLRAPRGGASHRVDASFFARYKLVLQDRFESLESCFPP